MNRRSAIEIKDGVLLSRTSEVHRDTGSATACGTAFTPGQVAPVSSVQAIVFKLRPCVTCYPGRYHTRGGAT